MLLIQTPTWVILLGVLLLVSAMTEAGFRAGRRCEEQDRTDVGLSASGAIKGAIVGLGGLVLAFSYGMALGRYDLRTQVVVREAQAMGTCWHMAELLPSAERERAKGALRSAAEARLRLFHEGDDPASYRSIASQIDRHTDEVWRAAAAAFAGAEEPLRLMPMLNAADAVSSREKERSSAVQDRVPAALLGLLVLSVAVTGFLMGHSSGQLGRRQWTLWLTLILLMVCVLTAVIDLDRPNRGLITVNHGPLERLLATMSEAGSDSAAHTAEGGATTAPAPSRRE